MSNSDPSENFASEAATENNAQLEEQNLDPSVYNPYHGLEDNQIQDLQAIAGQPVLPLPFPIQRHRVSGRYRGRVGSFEVELRVDVDGARAMNKISADFFHLWVRLRIILALW